MSMQSIFTKQIRFSFILINGLILLFLSFLMYKTALQIDDNNVIKILETKQKLWFDWLLGLIIAPVLETFLCQYLPFLIFQSFSKNILFPIIFSSIFFGISHNYSNTYIIFATIAGLILANAYALSQKRLENAFINVVLIHFTANFMEFTLVLLK